MKSGNLNFLEPSGPLQACNGTLLPFYNVLGLAIASGGWMSSVQRLENHLSPRCQETESLRQLNMKTWSKLAGSFVKTVLTSQGPRDQIIPQSDYKTLITCRSSTKGPFVRCGRRINTEGRSRVIKREVGGVNLFRGLCTEYTSRAVRTEMTQTHRPAVVCKGTSIFPTLRRRVSSVRTRRGNDGLKV